MLVIQCDMLSNHHDICQVSHAICTGVHVERGFRAARSPCGLKERRPTQQMFQQISTRNVSKWLRQCASVSDFYFGESA